MHGMEQMFLDLIGGDAERCPKQRRHSEWQSGERDVQIGAALQLFESGLVEDFIEQRAIHRPDRAERIAGAPRGEVEVLAMRPARSKYQLADARPDTEHGINASECASADAYRQLGRKSEPVGHRLIEAALPIAAVAASRECDRVEHQRRRRVAGDDRFSSASSACAAAGARTFAPLMK